MGMGLLHFKPASIDQSFMQRKLNIEEMAAELGFCRRTLRKYVTKYRIPHAKLGRDMRFDSKEVWDHLKDIAIEQEEPRRDLKPRKLERPKTGRSRQPDRYEVLLGLGGNQ